MESTDIDTSVVMITWSPTPRRLRVLKVSFDSLKMSTKRPHILVVVDNGPPSQTEWLNHQQIDIHIVNAVNQGIGNARNYGASATDTKYIAFVDSDIAYFDGWLDACVEVLEKYSDTKLISTPRKSSPMKFTKHRIGSLDEYELYNRASGQALVMKRQTWEEIGWYGGSRPGGVFCDSARKHGYSFIRHPSWKARHLCKRASYNHRHKLVNGVWVPRQEETILTGEQ